MCGLLAAVQSAHILPPAGRGIPGPVSGAMAPPAPAFDTGCSHLAIATSDARVKLFGVASQRLAVDLTPALGAGAGGQSAEIFTALAWGSKVGAGGSGWTVHAFRVGWKLTVAGAGDQGCLTQNSPLLSV